MDRRAFVRLLAGVPLARSVKSSAGLPRLHVVTKYQPLPGLGMEWEGQQRKLLLHANRNGFFYVLDRTNGSLLLAKPFVKKLTWASGISPSGRPMIARVRRFIWTMRLPRTDCARSLSGVQMITRSTLWSRAAISAAAASASSASNSTMTQSSRF